MVKILFERAVLLSSKSLQATPKFACRLTINFGQLWLSFYRKASCMDLNKNVFYNYLRHLASRRTTVESESLWCALEAGVCLVLFGTPLAGAAAVPNSGHCSVLGYSKETSANRAVGLVVYRMF